jgi:hypothetical protein
MPMNGIEGFSEPEPEPEPEPEICERSDARFDGEGR